MDSNALKIFLAVAEQGSVSRAAQKLHCVQSNVTARLRRLEDELGTALFHRTRRKMQLTSAGQTLLPYARSIQHLLAEAGMALQPSDRPSGPLRLGAMDTAAAVHLPPVLARYHQHYPEVMLHLVTGASDDMVTQVAEYAVEGALIGGSVDHPEIAGEEVLREELVFVSSRDRCELAEEDFAAVLVYRRGCSCRRQLEAWLAAEGRRPARLMEFGALDAILSCVGAGMGITLLPRSFVAREPFGGLVRTHAVPAPYDSLPIQFIRRRDVRPSPAMQAFRQLLGEG